MTASPVLYWVLVANVYDPKFRRGARVVLQDRHWQDRGIECYGISRGGRKIAKFVKPLRLENIRPSMELRPPKPWCYTARKYKTREEAQADADALTAAIAADLARRGAVPWPGRDGPTPRA